MATVYYRALLEPAADGGYGVIFPELPGCTSGGDTADEAARNAAEGLAGHLGLLLEDGDPIPSPAPLDAPLPDWLDEPGEPPAAGLVRLLVPAELPGKAGRIDIAMEEDLAGQLDAAAAARGVSRSALLAEAARRMLAEDR
jgi:predicted RNase H-like HicB family nuclease